MVNDKDLKNILNAYGIHLKEILQKENGTFFIREESESFVLHKSTMDQEQIDMWETVFHHANEHKIASILPIYPTAKGDLYVMRKDDMFYLTPYIETAETRNITDLFKTVATIHKKTKRTFIIPKQDLMASFKLYEDEMKTNRMYVQQTIDLFEQQQYMSPLELQVCSHFHVIDDAFEKSLDHVVSILEMCDEDENDHMEWSSSLCHNRLSTEYVLENQAQYIGNWEAASLTNATQDIAVLCRNEFLRNEYSLEPFIEGLIEYEELYGLSDLEEHILAIHLLHPLPYIRSLRTYISQRDEKPVISQVVELERLFRVVANSFNLLYEFEQQKPNMFNEASD